MSAFPLPPELLAPPPRRVVRRPGRGRGVFASVLTSSHALVGLGCFAVFAFLLGSHVAVDRYGQPFPGEVTSLWTWSGGKYGTSQRYYISYRYQVGGTNFVGWAQVSHDVYARQREGQPIPVRAVASFPAWFSEPVVPDRGPWGWIAIAGAAALAVNVVMGTAVWVYVVAPRLRHRLVRTGLPAAGSVLHTEVGRNKTGTVYRVRYQYDVALPGFDEAVPCSAELLVSRGDFLQIRDGQRVTVLYDPERPTRSIVYEYADFQAIAPPEH